MDITEKRAILRPGQNVGPTQQHIDSLNLIWGPARSII